ncbi:MAG: rod shape-determining protein MreC [Lactobacillaceae bacterium]|jgi:rod shape-determining protein MreC|nr:rod shape-determining protein MreC [Lactobacillaceae bacterium]
MRAKNKKLLFLKLSKIKLLTKRFAIVILFLSAFAFMLISKTDTKVIGETSSLAMNIVSPLIDTLSIPAKITVKGYDYAVDLQKTYKENIALKGENLKLNDENRYLKSLEIENRLLSRLLDYIPPPEATSSTIRIVATENDAFSNSVIAYTGGSDKIRKGHIAMSNTGVVGRVENVGKMYSKITLITDINSKIPVIVEKNRVRGILIGDNTNINKLMFTPRAADISIGDKIITSGIAGVFPPGLPVGVVISIDKSGIKVKPYADIQGAEYIRIIGYDIDEAN